MLMVVTIEENHWSLDGRWRFLLSPLHLCTVSAYVLKKWHPEIDIVNSTYGAPNYMCKLWFSFGKKMVYQSIIF